MVLPSKHLSSHSKWDGTILLTPEIPESETKQECAQNDQVWWSVTGWSLKITSPCCLFIELFKSAWTKAATEMRAQWFFLLATPVWCTCNCLFLIFSESFFNALINKKGTGLLEIWEKVREVKLPSFSSTKIAFRVLLIEMLCVKFKIHLEAIFPQIMLSYSLLSKIYTLHYYKGFVIFISFCFHSSFMRPLYKWRNTKWLISKITDSELWHST